MFRITPMSNTLYKEEIKYLRKVSIHVSLRHQRTLPWAKHFAVSQFSVCSTSLSHEYVGCLKTVCCESILI